MINKVDLAEQVRSDLGVMNRDARIVREGRPLVFTNCFTGEGLSEIVERIEQIIERHRAVADGVPA